MSNKKFSLLLSLLFLTASLSVRADTLTVAVAANMQYAFTVIQAGFKKETGHELKPVYNSSGKFTTQIMNGAPFDVFLAADMAFPEKLYKEGFTTAAPKVYAYGTLVLWTTHNLDLSNWQKTLTSPAVAKIAVANPTTAPYGREAMKALAKLKLNDLLQPKLVFGESIAQTNQYIHSGAADAGFTAKSVVLSPEMKGQGKWVELPTSSYEPIAQGAVILKYGQQNHAALSQQFYDFIYSAKARPILECYGYALP